MVEGRICLSMRVSTNRKRIIISLIVTAVLIFVVLFNYRTFIDYEAGSFRVFPFLLTFLLVLGVGAAICWKFELDEKWERRFSIGFLLLAPVLTFSVVECINENQIFVFTNAQFWMNLIWYYLAYALVYAVTNRIKLTIWITNTLLWLLGVANYTVLIFRGTPLMPWDFTTIKTGLSVMGGYTFIMSWNLMAATCLMLIINLLAGKTHYVHRNLKHNIIGKVCTVCATVVFVSLFYNTNLVANLGLKVDPWRQTSVYHNNGVVLAIAMNTQFLMVESPENYSSAQVEEIADNIVDAEPVIDMVSDTTEQVKPNIIVIMNESLADLSVLGDFETSEDYMPFLRSMEENTIKGNLYTSVYGAGTCNSEFEFLTGNSMAFLPTGSRPYQQYIKSDTYSLVSTLNQQGYTSLAVHPYYANGWDRDTVYPLLGFEEFYSIDDFTNPELIRGLISDRSSYAKLIELYEEKDPGEKLFLFNVTMQNHGGYTAPTSEFKQTIWLTDQQGDYFPKVEQYLSLVRESDQALKELVGYFSNQEEPTIILMFGDHQPTVEPEFVNKMLGGSEEEISLEQEQKKYITPFFIWANYDIPEKEIDHISANYLSNLLLETAGLEKTEYNIYLENLYQHLPVVNALGCIDNQGNFYALDDEDNPYQDLLNSYQVIQYNNLFDKKNRLDSVFSLPQTG